MKTLMRMSRRMLVLLLALLIAAEVWASSERNKARDVSTPPATGALAKPALAPNTVVRRQGFNLLLYLSNASPMGLSAFLGAPHPDNTMGCEYPAGTDIEHIFGGSIWIGGIIDTTRTGVPREVTAVTTGYEGWSGPHYEFYPSESAADSFWIVTSPVKPAGWDQYWGTSLPFRQVSEQDFYCTYTDTFQTPRVADHVPLRIKVIQKSYSWSVYAEAIIPIEYDIINVGTKRLRDVYIGYFVDGDVGPWYRTGFHQSNFTGYYQNLRTAYIHNPVDRGSTPMGLTLLRTSRPLDSLRYTFRWYPGEQSPSPDAVRYQYLSSGLIMPNQSITDLSDTRFLFGFGPFQVHPAETLRIAVAVLSGMNLDQLKRNAQRAVQLAQRGYRLPVIPPSPPLRTTIGLRRVELDWRWRVGIDTTFLNPEEAWDDSSRTAETFPDTNWRRRNPPPGHVLGGRVFEGYRVYRSGDPDGAVSTFTLLRQVDDPTDLFEFNRGLEYSFVDSNLVRGKTYWYAVTSFSIPNMSILEYRDPNDSTRILRDTTFTEALESSILQNRVKIVLPFSVSQKSGEVMVVPNPYRVDHDYTYEAGGWEGRAAKWTENNRLIKFIHLPPRCTIRIFTIAGDLVATLEHDDPNRGDRDWNLLSESKRALSSGIYVFAVESDFGTQVGKFVVIR
jgi:hypothetical protein